MAASQINVTRQPSASGSFAIPPYGLLVLEVDLKDHSHDCDCNVTSWECAREGTVDGYVPVSAVARFTLVPLSTPPRHATDAGWRELALSESDGLGGAVLADEFNQLLLEHAEGEVGVGA